MQLSVCGMLCCNHKSEMPSGAAMSQATVTMPPGLNTSSTLAAPPQHHVSLAQHTVFL